MFGEDYLTKLKESKTRQNAEITSILEKDVSGLRFPADHSRTVRDVIREQDEHAGHILSDEVEALPRPRAEGSGSRFPLRSGQSRAGLVVASPPTGSYRVPRSGLASESEDSESAADQLSSSPSGSDAEEGRGPSAGSRLNEPPTIQAEGVKGHNVPTVAPTSKPAGPRSRVTLLTLIPFTAFFLFVLIFSLVGLTAGRAKSVVGSPKAVVIIMEGFSGEMFDKLMEDGGVHMPHIHRLITQREGSWAACPVATDSRCAQAVSVEVLEPFPEREKQRAEEESRQDPRTEMKKREGSIREAQYHVYSSSSIASILSGVEPIHHGVVNNSIESLMRYTAAAKQYPSLAKIVSDAGLGVTVVGTAHLLHSHGSSWSCSEAGVLDMECADSFKTSGTWEEKALAGSSMRLDCMCTSSCNANSRRIQLPTSVSQDNSGVQEELFLRTVEDIFNSTSQPAGKGDEGASSQASSLFIFHFDALARRVESSYFPEMSYNTSSLSYEAQAYLIDAMVGQILAYVEHRSAEDRENWLVLGLSDHGGNGKKVNYNDVSGESSEDGVVDELELLHFLHASSIPFFMGTYISNSASLPRRNFTTLKAFDRPTSQLDVLPTVLRWLNVAPFDDETEASSGEPEKNITSTMSLKERKRAENLQRRKLYDGKVQGICTSGKRPLDCVL